MLVVGVGMVAVVIRNVNEKNLTSKNTLLGSYLRFKLRVVALSNEMIS